MKVRSSADPIAVTAVTIGALMFVCVPAALPLLTQWGRLYGTVLVYLAFAEYVAIATLLVRWGVGHRRQ